MSNKTSFSCRVVGDVLRIEIGISTLKYAAEHHEDFWQPYTDRYALVVSNERLFAKDVVHELNREGEDGSTPATRLFDVCISEAVNQGSEGCDHDAMDAIEEAERVAATT